jgi:uncharacterized protein YceK
VMQLQAVARLHRHLGMVGCTFHGCGSVRSAVTPMQSEAYCTRNNVTDKGIAYSCTCTAQVGRAV